MVKKTVAIYLNEGQLDVLRDYLSNLKQMMVSMSQAESFPPELDAIITKLERHV